MGCTLTANDTSAAFTTIVGALGQLWAPASATDQAIVMATANTQVNAEVTTASVEAGVVTGTAHIAATFMRF